MNHTCLVPSALARILSRLCLAGDLPPAKMAPPAEGAGSSKQDSGDNDMNSLASQVDANTAATQIQALLRTNNAAASLQQQALGPIIAPAALLAEQVVHKLKEAYEDNVLKSTSRMINRFGSFVSLTSMAFEGVKMFIKIFTRRIKRKRLRKFCDFVLDVAFPTTFWGPALGVQLAMLEQSGGLKLRRSGGGGQGGSAHAVQGPSAVLGAGFGGNSDTQVATMGVATPPITDRAVIVSSLIGAQPPQLAPPIRSNSPLAKAAAAVFGLRVVPLSEQDVSDLAHLSE